MCCALTWENAAIWDNLGTMGANVASDGFCLCNFARTLQIIFTMVKHAVKKWTLPLSAIKSQFHAKHPPLIAIYDSLKAQKKAPTSEEMGACPGTPRAAWKEEPQKCASLRGSAALLALFYHTTRTLHLLLFELAHSKTMCCGSLVDFGAYRFAAP